MAYTNNAMLIRRELLTRVVSLLKENSLTSKINRIPLEMRPRTPYPIRCCVHKDRAVIKYKLMAVLGHNIMEEEDELTPLSDYAEKALNRTSVDNKVLTVVDEACQGCIRINYMVTNMCRGCEGRPCELNCNKNAIKIVENKAVIDHALCVNCGICKNACPFHAIAYIPVPCEDSCPVGAIKQGEDGVRDIIHEKCISCGKCVVACPFGAVMEKSNIVDIISAIQQGKQVIAMVAPSIAGQFKAPLENILGSFRDLGFTDVYEVAKGANKTTASEASELAERLEEGHKLMTTSCCKAWTELVSKHMPEMEPYVSHTKTPLYYTAEIARAKYPDAILVFVGPCLSKRKEVMETPLINFMLSFEEYGTMLVTNNHNVALCSQAEVDSTIEKSGRGYAVSGGVTKSVMLSYYGPEVKPLLIDGIDKTSIKLLKGYAKGDSPVNFIEIMSCEGGCVNGCGVISNPKVARRQIEQLSS